MAIATGFHTKCPTDIESEIGLANNLYFACLLRYGERKSAMLRTDPARVFRRMKYTRAVPQGENTWLIIHGHAIGDEARPTNDAILTPSNPEWPTFIDAIAKQLRKRSFDFWYGGSRRGSLGGTSTEYWPLCSAQLTRELGFAVAESLCLFRVFLGSDDRAIYESVERMWASTKPIRWRTPFDVADHNAMNRVAAAPEWL